MTIPWEAVGSWPVRVLVAGGAVLLGGRVLVALARQPARRVWVGTAAVVAALLAIPMSLLPGWVTIPVSEPAPAVAANVGQATAADRGVDVPLARADVARAGAFEPEPPEGGRPPEAPAAGAAAVTATPMPEVRPADTPATTGPGAPFDWVPLLAWAYIGIAAALVLRLVAGHVSLARLWRRAHPAPVWARAAFRRLAGPVCPRAELRVTGRAVGPICFGVLRPRVLVPASLLLTGDGPPLRAVFAHELAHLGRRDPLAGWLLGLARAAYFACPWLAGLRREVRVAQECLADAAAATHAAGPAPYAELLIRMARSRPAPLGAAGARGPSSELYRRVTMLLRTAGPVERRCPRRWALTVGGGLTALAVLVAGLSVQPRPAAAAPATEPPAEPAKKAEKKDAPKPKAEGDKRDAGKRDPIKDVIDKLRNDLKGDPEALKHLEDALKEAEKMRDRAPDVAAPRGIPPVPRRPLPPDFPRIDPLDADKELEAAQDMIRAQLEQLQRQLQAGGLRGGGLMIGPEGVRPFGRAAIGGRVRLGIQVEKPSDVLSAQLDLPPGKGLVCADVPADSVAGKAGIKPNDVLLEIGGTAVPSDFAEFQRVLADVKPDAPVDVVVMRKGKKETIKGVKLPEGRPVADVPAFRDFVPPALDLDVGPATRLGPRAGARGGVVAVGPGESVRVEQVNDAFTIFYAKDGVKVTIAGTKDGGAPKAESIEVDDNGKTTRAESIDKLPKEYRELAEKALKSVK